MRQPFAVEGQLRAPFSLQLLFQTSTLQPVSKHSSSYKMCNIGIVFTIILTQIYIGAITLQIHFAHVMCKRLLTRIDCSIACEHLFPCQILNLYLLALGVLFANIFISVTVIFSRDPKSFFCYQFFKFLFTQKNVFFIVNI